jgi:hypothetical protein
MAALKQRQTMLLIASAAFVVLQLTELVSAATGQASFYTAPYVPNACFGFGGVPSDNMFAAGGDSGGANIWNNGGNCGNHFSIKCVGNGCRNGGGPIRVEIIDRCPNGCAGGRAFDLSAEAFAAIADPDVGVITVQYSSAVSDEDRAVPWAREKLIAQVGHM